MAKDCLHTLTGTATDTDVRLLAKVLQYDFQNLEYLRQALTHARLNLNSIQNNERMEFLGDAILNFIISKRLHDTYPNSNEGELSRLRAYLVRSKTLIALAQTLGLARYLKMSYTEQKSLDRSALLENAMEAIFAAIYLDGGLAAVDKVINRLYDPYFRSQFAESAKVRDPKTILQEYCQAQKQPLPQYELIAITGKPPKQTFALTCRIEKCPQVTEGKGANKRSAQQMAAEKMLALLKKTNS